MKIRTLTALVAGGLILSGCGADTTAPDTLTHDVMMEAGPAAMSATVNPIDRSVYPVEWTLGVCTEVVDFAGEVVTQIHWADPSDQATTEETFFAKSRLQGIRGVGQLSGDVYHLLGQEAGTFGPASFGANGERITTIIKQRYIRQGSGKEAEVLSTFHYVVNPSGLVLERYEFVGRCL